VVWQDAFEAWDEPDTEIRIRALERTSGFLDGHELIVVKEYQSTRIRPSAN